MRNTCIICGSEFQSPRSARFCPDKPGCRQSYNRKERTIKDAAKQLLVNLDLLIQASNDPNFAALARSELLQAEKNMIFNLDVALPGRHPKKAITAYPVFVEPEPGDKVYAFDPRYAMGDMIKLEVQKVSEAWVEGAKASDRWKTITLSRGCVFLKMVEPETDQAGREVVDKYNPGWGAVVNPDRQIEISQIDTTDGDEEDYSEDEEEY